MSVGVGFKGRKVVLTLAGQSIAGIQTKGLAVTNEGVEVTDDGSDGWTEKLAEPGTRAVELTFSGAVKNLELLRAALSNTSQIYAATLTYPEGSAVAGDFFMDSFSDTGEHNFAYTFDISLSSSGEVSFTAGTGS